MAKSLYDQAATTAAQSKEELQDLLLARFHHNDPLLSVIARTLIDAKIEATLSGMAIVSDNVQLDAYERGYLDGLSDAQ
jgi:hypothetical protein